MDDTTSTEAIGKMLLAMVQAIVDKPSETVIVPFDVNGATCFRVGMAKDDMGKVIGKQGRMARAIRTVLGAASMKCGRRFTLDIGEDGVTARNGDIVPQRSSPTEPTSPTSLREIVRGTGKRSQALK